MKRTIKNVTSHWAQDPRNSEDCGASIRVCEMSDGKFDVIDVDRGPDAWGNNEALPENSVGSYSTEAEAVEAMWDYYSQCEG